MAETARQAEAKARFDNVLGLIGLPRSGTTVVTRALSSHPSFLAEIEPYHSRRAAGFEETDPGRFFSGIGAAEEAGKSILVKETTTRAKNTKLLFELLAACREQGYQVQYAFILRSPLDAFLSQVSAAKKFWDKAEGFGNSDKSFGAFQHAFRVSMRHYIPSSFKFGRQAVIYDSFVENPRPWVRRIVESMGLELPPGPVTLGGDESRAAGDPTARESRTIMAKKEDRYAAAREDLLERFGKKDEYKLMRAVHDIIEDAKAHFPGTDPVLRSIITECKTAIAEERERRLAVGG